MVVERHVLATTLFALSLSCVSVDARTVTLFFDGNVIALDGPGEDERDGRLDAIDVSIGDAVRGNFSFDTSVNQDVNGFYNFSQQQANLSISVNGQTWNTGGDVSAAVVDEIQYASGGSEDFLSFGSTVRPSQDQINSSRSFPGSSLDFDATNTIDVNFIESRTDSNSDGFLSNGTIPTRAEDLNLGMLEQSSVVQFEGFVSSFGDDGGRAESGWYYFYFDIDPQSLAFSSESVDPVLDRPAENISRTIATFELGLEKANIETWEQSFDWSIAEETLLFDVEIYLDDEAGAADAIIEDGIFAGQTFRDTWKQEIEAIWNSGNAVLASQNPSFEDITLDFNVDFVPSPIGADFEVTVADQFEYTPNVLNWATDLSYVESRYTTDYTGSFAAHEFGHMLGLYDEYRNSANSGIRDPNLTVLERLNLCNQTSRGEFGPYCSSIMGSLNGAPELRHYEKLLDFTGFTTDEYLLTAELPAARYPTREPLPLVSSMPAIAAVPLPASAWLLIFALVTLFVTQRTLRRNV